MKEPPYIEVLSRKQCSQCKGEQSWIAESSHGYEHTVYCPCRKTSNVAGPGFEVAWKKIAVYPLEHHAIRDITNNHYDND